MNSPRHDSLGAALANLPLEIAPARDLWPEIRQATGADRRSRWPAALAASVALFTLVSALSWSVWRHTSGEIVVAQNLLVTPGATRQVSYQLLQDVEYQAACSALERTFAERMMMLAPGTRERVQQDLEIIRKANADTQIRTTTS